MTNQCNLDNALSSYGKTAKSTTGKGVARMIGFGAAAAGGLLTCNQAEADIVWSGPLNFTWADTAYSFDIDADGNVDIGFGVQGSVSTSLGGAGTAGWAVFGLGTKGGFAMQGTGAVNYPAALQQSFSAGTVSAGNVESASTGWMGWAANGAAASDAWGAFANPGVSQTGYVGLQFNGSTAGGDSAGTMNAWVKFGVRFDDNNDDGVMNAGDSLSASLFEWAYNDDPTSTFNGRAPDDSQSFSGTPGGIHIGAISVPEPGSMSALALLSLGAVGVRRRKKTA